MRSKSLPLLTCLCVLVLIDIVVRMRDNDCDIQKPMQWIPDERNEKSVSDGSPTSLDTACVVDEPCAYPDDVALRLIVMSFDRENALRKALESLEKLDSMGDTIALEIWIDRNATNAVHQGTLNVANNFKWHKGPFRVHVQQKHAGIYGQWIDTWKPKQGSNELALLVEDDLIISPYAWRWLKASHANYGRDASVMGYTLQSEKVRAAAKTNDDINAGSDPVFFYRLIGSWGFAPHPVWWRAFQAWFHKKRLEQGFHPYVDDLIMTSWYKNFEKKSTADSMWTMWFIYYTNERNLYCLYNNLNRMTSATNRSLAVHREEPGLHYKGTPRANAEQFMLRDWSPKYIDFPEKTKRLGWDGKPE